ncbi:unannotated protein [freshwater metagenome]|uniref:Unannotated protein n=2 Tax=freshwater metagenome TaxID=449393 RepID=A0A6J7C032_9ZZZZ
MMNLKMPEYIPGTCNIGVGEIRRRQVVALVGAIFSLISLAGMFLASAPRGARFGIFLPLAVASIGWVQSRKKFCLAYGFMGTFNFGKLGQLSRVADSASKSADRKTALSILVQSLLIAGALTLIVVALPL